MNFGEAIQVLKAGGQVRREGWNGKNMHLELQVPDKNSKMTLPYIFMRTAQGDNVPWLASQTDMLEDSDWEADISEEGDWTRYTVDTEEAFEHFAIC